MLHHGLYEQVINNQLTSELAEVPEARKAVVPIDKAEASKVLAQYLADVVQKGLDNVLDNGGDLSAQIALTNQIVDLIQNTTKEADFEREGRTYTLLDLLKNDQTETDTREHIEVVTLESKTKDMAEILKMLEPKLEVKTEDGYEGILSLDHTTIQVEAAGYGTSSCTVTAERTYPNLSDADVSLVPKSVNENGRTLTLADVSWQEAAVDPTDGYDIPIRYTAVASYTGTATSKYATGYTVTADYKGDVTRTSCDTVVYTAVFSSVGAAASAKSGVDFNWLWLLIPVGAAALGGCGYAGYKGYKHYINKKRGYAT